MSLARIRKLSKTQIVHSSKSSNIFLIDECKMLVAGVTPSGKNSGLTHPHGVRTDNFSEVFGQSLN